MKEGLVCHAWNELPDYSAFRTKDDLRELYEATYPRQNEKRVISGLGQVWRFAHEIKKDDLVALPLRPESAVAFGQVTGEYEYKKVAPNVMHIHKVAWLKTVPRSIIPLDILNSINGMLTVFKVSRNDAERRVKKLVTMTDAAIEDVEVEVDDTADAERVDLEEEARDGILKFIQTKFTGHDLARLVDAVLRAQGYKTELSSPGPDGGVDILAGSGPLGFDKPRVCVQVKSGAGAEGQKTYNELRGVVTKFGVEQGLLVSWGGFTNAVKQDARKDFFAIRLWDQGDVVEMILENYERLDESIKAELPLRRIWAIVDDESSAS